MSIWKARPLLGAAEAFWLDLLTYPPLTLFSFATLFHSPTPQVHNTISSAAPILGGSFAVWGGAFSSFDCSLAYIRQKEDPWNSIASGFLTGGVLTLRSGLRASFQSAVVGGVLLALIEGLGIAINRMVAEQHRPQMPQLPAPTKLPPTQSLPAIPATVPSSEFAPDD